MRTLPFHCILLFLLNIAHSEYSLWKRPNSKKKPTLSRGLSLTCYDCNSDQGTCNEGECEGLVCIKMETSNKDNDRKTIQKGCGDDHEEVACQQSGFGSKWMSRCVCDTPFCNADQALIDAGLEPSSAPPPPGSFTQFALLVAILVFVGASCSLIVIATICVQFC